MDPVLNNVGLRRQRQQTAEQQTLRQLQLAIPFQQARTMVDQGRARLIGLRGARPGGQRRLVVAGALQQQAVIDRGGGKIRPQRQRGLVRLHGARFVTRMSQFRTEIEPCSEQMPVADGVERDPAAVKLNFLSDLINHLQHSLQTPRVAVTIRQVMVDLACFEGGETITPLAFWRPNNEFMFELDDVMAGIGIQCKKICLRNHMMDTRDPM